MARTDQLKLDLWARRVQLQRDSGLSVSKFCQREELAVHDFYYWRRKLTGGGQQASSVDSRKQTPVPEEPAGRNGRGSGADVGAMVQIQLGDRACVSVPAHMLDAIRTVLQTVLSCDSDNPPSSLDSAFHPVIVRS